MKAFTSREIDAIMCRTGYVRLSEEVYLYGEIRETGISGAAGYYAVLEGSSYGLRIKVGIYGMEELLDSCGAGDDVPDGVIVLGK